MKTERSGFCLVSNLPYSPSTQSVFTSANKNKFKKTKSESNKISFAYFSSKWPTTIQIVAITTTTSAITPTQMCINRIIACNRSMNIINMNMSEYLHRTIYI